MDFKRTMSEIRESIRTNWTTTGQELGRELRQFWQSSRPSSPAPPSGKRSGRTSPTAVSHLSHLDIPKSSPAHGNGSADFAAGYSLGLIGGVRSWVSAQQKTPSSYSANVCFVPQMDRSRRNLNDPSRGDSDSTDEGELNSPEEAPRGRTGQASSSSSSTKIPPSKNVQAEVDAQVQHEQSKA
jgi:choline-phosphate cytidylyltransferase